MQSSWWVWMEMMRGADGTQWTHSMRLDISSGVTHKQSSDKSGLSGQRARRQNSLFLTCSAMGGSLRIQGLESEGRGVSSVPGSWRGGSKGGIWRRCPVTPYLGRQRPHPAGCRPRWCGSPWWRRLHPAAPRRCWRWRCCCSCSCSSLCGTAAPTPFSDAPVPWMIRREGRRGVVEIYTHCVCEDARL